MSKSNIYTKEETSAETKKKTVEPPMYKVFLNNDDYTTMDFVVEILISVFHKSEIEAIRIMFDVHRTGIGVCGIYSFEVAETKVDIVHKQAKKKNFLLNVL